MLVSIVTPVYNSENYIGDCINSILQQSYENFELIIIDDCSTDNTLGIVDNYLQFDSRIKLIKLKENSGPAVARNTGIEIAQGDYLTFIDSDDLWMHDFIQKSIDKVKEEQCGFVFASYKRLDEKLNPLLSDFIVTDKVTYGDILKSNPISCLTAFIDIKSLGKKYMPLIRKRQDLGLWLSYLKELDYAVGIKEPLAIYRIRENSISRNKWRLISYQWYFYFNIEKLGFPRSVYYLLNWMIRGYLKYRT